MVKKLFKHEILAWLRVWTPMQIILLAVAAFGRVWQFFENDSMAYDIIFGSAVGLYVVAIIASIGLVTVFGVVRFYKNLFSREGYLSFTLPVTPAQHIWVKMLTAGLFSLLSLVVIFLSFGVFTAGEFFVEIVKALSYIMKQAIPLLGAHLIFYIIEFVLLMAVAVLGGSLLYYTCIALGQTFKKNRVIGAIGVYFIYYIINQVIGTVLSVIIMLLAQTDFFLAIGRFIEENPFETVHIVLCGSLVLSSLLAALYFVITHAVMRKKLNLE